MSRTGRAQLLRFSGEVLVDRQAARRAVGRTRTYQPHSATFSPSPGLDGDNPVRPSGRAPADPPPRDRAPGGPDCRTAPHPTSAGEHRAPVAGIIAIAGHDADFRARFETADGLPTHNSGRATQDAAAPAPLSHDAPTRYAASPGTSAGNTPVSRNLGMFTSRCCQRASLRWSGRAGPWRGFRRPSRSR